RAGRVRQGVSRARPVSRGRALSAVAPAHRRERGAQQAPLGRPPGRAGAPRRGGGLGGRGSVPRGGRALTRSARGAPQRPRRAGGARSRRARASVPARSRRGGDRRDARDPARDREVPHVAGAGTDARGARGGGVVNGLEHELRALAPHVEWPDAPDVASAVAARVAMPRPRRTPSRRVGLVLAVLLLALAVALAVPPARTAIFDWLGIGSARIERVDELPPLQPSAPVALLGEPTTLAEARRRAGFRVAPPPRNEPAPDEIRV